MILAAKRRGQQHLCPYGQICGPRPRPRGAQMAGESSEIDDMPACNPSSSPCFDISEFLGTPRKDGGSNTDEVFSNLSGLNLSPSAFGMLAPLPPLGVGGCCKAESDPDFSALLLYNQKDVEVGGAGDQVVVDGAGGGRGDLISLDEIEAHLGAAAAVKDDVDDAFALFGCSSHHHQHHHSDLGSLVNTSVSVAYPPGESRLLNFPAHQANLFGQHGSFLAAGGGDSMLAGGEDHHQLHAGGSIASSLSGDGGPTLSSPFASAVAAGSNACDWGVLCEGPAHHHHHHHAAHPASAHNALQCDSCQILRCIIHSNGVQDTKLEIHGCDNISYHAVLHTRFCIDDGFPTALEQQMVEFPVGNGEYVRQFLLQYSLLRRKEGFVLRHDSMSTSVDQGSGLGFVPDRGFNASGPFLSKQIGAEFPSVVKPGQGKLHQPGTADSSEQGEPSAAPVKPPKSNAAAQRERTGKLKMSDLAQHFHLPINAAAKELGICPTVLKKICRRNGMRRWPHRKIKSIERIIATLEQTIAEGAGQGDEGIRMEIAMLRNERAQLCAGLLGQN